MINDCHTLAADGLTVVTVMTLFNHLWFLFSLENSVCKILLKFWQSDRKTRIAGANLILTTPQVFLDHRPREEVQRLVAAKTNGATPLVLSCRSHHLSSPDTQGNLSHLFFFFRNGHHEVVEYLVDRCCASVEQVPSSRTRYC